jgi:hypothetical protein
MKVKLATIHKIVISTLIFVVILTVSILTYIGYNYYGTSLEERYFHPENQSLKASGIIGHGLGIIGSLMIIFAVFSYMARKRIKRFGRVGILKYWLEMHIFLCTLGPVLILFHTTFKFGGIVAVSFWSMVAVVLSGVIGRFIYIQIPRSIEGRELSLLELDDIKTETNKQLRKTITLDESIYELINNSAENKSKRSGNLFWSSKEERFAIKKIRTELKLQKVPGDKTREIIQSFKDQISLKKRIERLVTMQNLFKYWHVAHLPFALVMLVIMIIHVVVVITFGYKWIF